MKHLQYYLDTVNDPARTAKYSGFINAQGSAIVHYGTGPGYTVGSVWYAPNAGASVLCLMIRRTMKSTNEVMLRRGIHPIAQDPDQRTGGA